LDVSCRSGNLASISLPLKVYFSKESVRNLTISDGKVTHLTGAIFKGVTNVSSLGVESCGIESLSSDVLSPLEQLRMLSLKNNLLSLVPTESLKMFNLTHLDLSNNTISILSGTTFTKSFSSMVYLNMSRNNISKIESTCLALVSSLEELDLSHNQVSKLERNVLKSCKRMKLLDLSFNSFSSLDRSDFVELIGLQVIRLASMNSKLVKLPQSIFARNSQLHTIDVSGNFFTEVDAYITRGVRFLRNFLASSNKITSIAKRAFSTNTRIRIIDLSRNLLTSIPSDMFTGLQYLESLDLSNNLIKNLDPGSFQSIFRIDINLSYNQLNFITRNSFIDCSNISTLDVSYNNLSRIHPEAFLDSDVTNFLLNNNRIVNLTQVPIGNLTGIRFLNLSYNEITSVNRKSFGLKQNTKLYEAAIIDLSFNHLNELSGSMFEKFWALRHLNLSNNKFIRLGFGSFGNLPTLLDLNLDNNQLREIGSINGLISLKSLFVRNNSLKSIPMISVALNELHLEDNRIDSVSCSSFPMMNSLLSLHLRNNSISSLDPDSLCNLITLRFVDISLNNISDVESVTPALQKLSSLQSLDLSFNKITGVNSSSAFGNLPTLFTLNLSGNAIYQVAPFAFNGLLQLLSLNLSRNAISSIEQDSLKGLVSLQSLDFSFNSLSRIENRTNSFFEDLLSLESLYLAGNRLSFLTPKSLPSSQWVPYKIRFLDLSYNHLESVSTAVGFSQMQELFIHHNHIRSLVPGVFGNMSSLRVLDLSFNRIPQIPLNAFSYKGNVSSKDAAVFAPTLRFLNLSNNRIESIEGGELTRISLSLINTQESTSSQNLEAINLSNNRLSSSWPETDVSILVGRGVSVNLTGNPLPCSCRSRLQVDAVRKSIQRISPRLSRMLTFNHDVNTYKSADNVVITLSSLPVMNEARVEWDSLTCQADTMPSRVRTSSSRKRSRTRRPRHVNEDPMSESVTTSTPVEEFSSNTSIVLTTSSTTTVAPTVKDPLLSHLSSNELSCSDQESLSLLEGDVLVRGISWLRTRKPALRIVWFIRNEDDDVASVRVDRSEVDPDSDSTSESLEMPYTEREYTFSDVNPLKGHRICIRSFDSRGRERPVSSSCLSVSPRPR